MTYAMWLEMLIDDTIAGGDTTFQTVNMYTDEWLCEVTNSITCTQHYAVLSLFHSY